MGNVWLVVEVWCNGKWSGDAPAQMREGACAGLAVGVSVVKWVRNHAREWYANIYMWWLI